MTQTQRQLAAIPAPRRRQAALVLALFATLLTVAGALPWTAPAPIEVRVISVAALLAAALALLIAWGLLRSVSLTERRAREAELDAVLRGQGCDCGHDHSHADGPQPAPASTPCGATDQADCPHTCDSCVLSRQAQPQ